jgi:hypothetical protein
MATKQSMVFTTENTEFTEENFFHHKGDKCFPRAETQSTRRKTFHHEGREESRGINTPATRCKPHSGSNALGLSTGFERLIPPAAIVSSESNGRPLLYPDAVLGAMLRRMPSPLERFGAAGPLP